MTVRREVVRFLNSIGFRISGTCWLVTLLTLGIFVVVNLPQQQKDLLDDLRSKAQGVSSSLQDITAGAAVSEDYSAVVDHCIQVLRGDDAIEYLVVTKTDGFSVIVDRRGWRTETLLAPVWRPEGNKDTSAIEYISLVGKRAFRFSRPFDYSGIRWGWVSVGLSTAAYDQSVARVYQRTAWLGLVSAAMSLLISFGQARRLVKPIVTLQSVVRHVAGGDLSARAEIRGGDEIGDLAKSFNTMTDTIMQRNRILESVRLAGEQLLSADDWSGVVEEVLAKIGDAARVSRASLFENYTAADGSMESRKTYEWVRPGLSPSLADWRHFRWEGPAREHWARQLAAGEEVFGELSRGDRGDLRHIDPALQSIIFVPVHAAENWCGLLALEKSTPAHLWGEAEKDSFRAVAGMFGAAITSQRAKKALIDARDNLELRVRERTRELQSEISAKEEANARLAEAQQHLMALSRQAGMAEVATGVLHNVGNVLNSVNVSASMVAGKIRESRVGNLLTLTGMLQEHSHDLPHFLESDPKGQRVVPYLAKLSSHLEEERQVMVRELELLTGHIGHIKEIVATQQSYAKVSGLSEFVPLTQLIEDVISIVRPGLERHKISLERNFEALQPVAVDKHAVLQILLNLLRNAKEALKESNLPGRVIRIRTRNCGDDSVRVEVIDSGVGLLAENLTRIFSHGFTTRRDGHGFGLHSGAIAAKQMGGSLWAESEGPGRGATFILQLPLPTKKNQKESSSYANSRK